MNSALRLLQLYCCLTTNIINLAIEQGIDGLLSYCYQQYSITLTYKFIGPRCSPKHVALRLHNIHNIMHTNIHNILTRGNRPQSAAAIAAYLCPVSQFAGAKSELVNLSTSDVAASLQPEVHLYWATCGVYQPQYAATGG